MLHSLSSRLFAVALVALPFASFAQPVDDPCTLGCEHFVANGMAGWYVDPGQNWHMAVKVVIGKEDGVCVADNILGCKATPCQPEFHTYYQSSLVGSDLIQTDEDGITTFRGPNLPPTSGGWGLAWQRTDQQACGGDSISVTATITSPIGNESVTCTSTSDCSSCDETLLE